jgi:hypothetical protein
MQRRNSELFLEAKRVMDSRQLGEVRLVTSWWYNNTSSLTPQHIRNFMDCIRTRKDPNASVQAGRATTMTLCMTMDSLRAGRRLKWNAKTHTVNS